VLANITVTLRGTLLSNRITIWITFQNHSFIPSTCRGPSTTYIKRRRKISSSHGVLRSFIISGLLFPALGKLQCHKISKYNSKLLWTLWDLRYPYYLLIIYQDVVSEEMLGQLHTNSKSIQFRIVTRNVQSRIHPWNIHPKFMHVFY